MRVLISGAGLAGMTLAYWLHQYGFTPVIIEKAPELRRSGYGLDFFGTGYDVAERMGLIESLRGRHIGVNDISLVDRKGHAYVKLTMDTMEKVMGGRYMALLHSDLEEILYEAIADKVEIRFGQSLTRVEQTSEAVTLTFNNGAVEQFDLLVGADGIHSNTRGLVFGPESQFARFMGYRIASYLLTDRYGIGPSWQNYNEPGRQVAAYWYAPGQIASLFIWKTSDDGDIPRSERLACLRQAFAGMGWETQAMLDDAPDPANLFIDTVTQIQMPVWSKGRVVLIGDACECMTLISGNGASMALGCAYFLAQALRDAPDYHEAFTRYEHQMRPEIEWRQKNARSLARSVVPDSRLGLLIRRAALKLVFRDAFIPLLRRMFSADSMFEKRALHYLPDSHGHTLGYRINGTLTDADYATLRLDVDAALEHSDHVDLLLRIEHLQGVTAKGVEDDLRFGLERGRKVRNLAIVGDGFLTRWLAPLARPLYAAHVQSFHANQLDAAWQWLAAG